MLLDRLCATSQGPDEIPYWFLKAMAPALAKPLTFIYNLSVSQSSVPSQWKKAIISPLPKIPIPLTCADFRPISLTPILSRLLDKIIIGSYIYPAISAPHIFNNLHDQFAFRPTGSTEAALIAILHHITMLLVNNPYVRVIALDFSKAFDTLRHSTTLSKLATLPVPDSLFNWFTDYFLGHSHVTRFQGTVSSSANINAGVFQGSAVGPPLYIINGLDFKPLYANNYIDKYADDSYLIVPACNKSTVLSELGSIERWAMVNNLNKNKSQEIIVFPSERSRNKSPTVPTLPDIEGLPH